MYFHFWVFSFIQVEQSSQHNLIGKPNYKVAILYEFVRCELYENCFPYNRFWTYIIILKSQYDLWEE